MKIPDELKFNVNSSPIKFYIGIQNTSLVVGIQVGPTTIFIRPSPIRCEQIAEWFKEASIYIKEHNETIGS
jgi:hypothetical protein